jgi:hypothetical protein
MASPGHKRNRAKKKIVMADFVFIVFAYLIQITTGYSFYSQTILSQS